MFHYLGDCEYDSELWDLYFASEDLFFPPANTDLTAEQQVAAAEKIIQYLREKPFANNPEDPGWYDETSCFLPLVLEKMECPFWVNHPELFEMLSESVEICHDFFTDFKRRQAVEHWQTLKSSPQFGQRKAHPDSLRVICSLSMKKLVEKSDQEAWEHARVTDDIYEPSPFLDERFGVERLDCLEYTDCINLLFASFESEHRIKDIGLNFALDFLYTSLFVLLDEGDKKALSRWGWKSGLKALGSEAVFSYHEQFSEILYILLFVMKPENWQMEAVQRFEAILEHIDDMEQFFYSEIYPRWQETARKATGGNCKNT